MGGDHPKIGVIVPAHLGGSDGDSIAAIIQGRIMKKQISTERSLNLKTKN
jgi:hypothetical protein